tara:strand:- start:145 stop:777 length:633 start_codon:yes stop_codon:yes gene_type:complete
MTSIANGESGSSVRTKLNNSLAITDAFSGSSGALTVTASSATAALTITQTGAGNAFVVEDSASPDSTPFVVDASGNVGIGTTSPVKPLTVSTADQNSARVRIVNTSGRTYDIVSGVDALLQSGFSIFDVTGATTIFVINASGNAGIGTNSPNAASILDAQSTTKGVRFPNMTTTQKTAIANVAGNVVFDTTLGKLCVNSGSGWQTITSVT